MVYDTQPGAAITAAPTMVLGGGRVQVHTNAQLADGGPNPSAANPPPLTQEELRPIVQERGVAFLEELIAASELLVDYFLKEQSREAKGSLAGRSVRGRSTN